MPTEDRAQRVLNALRYHLMDPALFKEFCDEFTREMNRLRMEGSASIEPAQTEIKRIERELDTLLNLILKGGAAIQKWSSLKVARSSSNKYWLTPRGPGPCCTPRWQLSMTNRSALCTRHCSPMSRQPG